MGSGSDWIASAFKVVEGLIGLRRAAEPDRSGDAASQNLEPETLPAIPPDAVQRPEPTAGTDTLPEYEAKIEIETPPAQAVETRPVQQDDESRRKLIRQLFNDYWIGLDDKPPTFAERLELAERYINERLVEREVGWTTDFQSIYAFVAVLSGDGHRTSALRSAHT